jgi:hypothetical protein
MTKRLVFITLILAIPMAFIGRPGPVQAPVTFSDNVAPIIFTKCSGCHRPGEAAPFSLLSYDDVRKRGKLIVNVTQTRYMPPWHATSDMGAFREDRRLTDVQIRTIQQWVDGGMVEGDPRKLPPLREFTPGWQLGQPDLVVKMSEPFDLPADGPDVFRNFAIPLNLKKDQWVKAVEFRSAARSSHHALFFLDQTGQAVKMDEADPRPGFAGMSFLAADTTSDASRGGRGGLLQRLQNRGSRLDLARSSLGGWAVGATPQPLPEGLARALPQESDLVLQMHFHPTGKVEREQATVGLYFADAPPRRTLTALQLPPLFGALAGIDIPAGEKHFVIKDSFTLPIDAEVISVGAHAHYLAKDMRMTATLPGGAARELVRIPDWKFNWQERYYFKDFVRLPRGTRLEVEISYDNSRDNVSNPNNPPKRVTFGQQSTDEMGSVTIELVPANERDLPQYAAAVQQHLQEAVVGRVISGLRGVRGGR